MSQGSMAWWWLVSVFLVVAFATAASQTSKSLENFPGFFEDKSVSGKWDPFTEQEEKAVSGKWDLYASLHRNQALGTDDDYDVDEDYNSGTATVGEEKGTKGALRPRSSIKHVCPFTPAPEDLSTIPPETVVTVPPRPHDPEVDPVTPMPVTLATPVPSTGAQNCHFRLGQRVTCGSGLMSRRACEDLGCCFKSDACFYPMNECTQDRQFVFAIHREAPNRDTVDPRGLSIPSDPNCKPVIVNGLFAVFKFSIQECGSHFYNVGGTNIYLAEVETPITTLNLKYGVITRSKPVRFLFECRYDGDGPVIQKSLVSIGYMVKTPFSNFPSQIVSDGLFAIQLRIARDPTFTSWVVDRVPLRELVNGEPVYLEVRLRSPKPKAVLLVNYCIAYPRSATNALVIIYEGCANPFDPTAAILRVIAANRYTRRFKVDAFQFMDVREGSKYINEDIYFMCATELCMPLERPCPQRCFDGKQRTMD